MTKKRSPTVDLKAAEKTAGVQIEEANQYLEHIQRMEITTDPELHFAVGVAAEIKEKHAAVDGERKGFIEDAQSIIDRANAFFQPALKCLAECEKVVKGKVIDYDLRQGAERDRLLEQAGQSGIAGFADKAQALLDEADKHITPKVPGLAYRRSMSVEITDVGAAIAWCIENDRLELLQLNEKAIKALAKAADGRGLELPGVIVTRSSTAAITVSKVER